MKDWVFEHLELAVVFVIGIAVGQIFMLVLAFLLPATRQ